MLMRLFGCSFVLVSLAVSSYGQRGQSLCALKLLEPDDKEWFKGTDFVWEEASVGTHFFVHSSNQPRQVFLEVRVVRKSIEPNQSWFFWLEVISPNKRFDIVNRHTSTGISRVLYTRRGNRSAMIKLFRKEEIILESSAWPNPIKIVTKLEEVDGEGDIAVGFRLDSGWELSRR